jgi:hypothetical protein
LLHIEDVALLSVKHGVDTLVIMSALRTYLVTADPVFRLASGIQDTSRGPDMLYPQITGILAQLDTISTRTGIPRETLAELLFDIRVAYSARHAANR